MPTITVKLSESDAELLEQLRQSGGKTRSKSEVIRELLQSGVKVINGNTAGEDQENIPTETVEVLRDVVEILKGQLQVKDKQIQDLNDRLKEANTSTQAAQVLQAADKQPAMLETPEQKQSWIDKFKAWFRD